MVAEKRRKEKLPEQPQIEATPEELELYFLSSVRTLDQINRAVIAGVRAESFQVAAHERCWAYLYDRSRQGVEPTVADVFAVTGVELIREITDEPIYQDDLISRTIYRMVAGRIMDLGDELPRNPRVATQRFIGDLAEIVAQSAAHSRDLVGGITERQQRVLNYVAMQEAGQVIGISTGLNRLDTSGYTWRPGELIAIQGPLNVGKSFLLLWFCAHAFFHSNKKILYMTPETTIDEIELRLDPMLATFMGMRLSNRALRTGRVDSDAWNTYCEQIALRGLENRWNTRDSGANGFFTVKELVDTAREVRPDIVAIDGIHLIRGDGKSWESMKEASELLKGLAQNQGCVVMGVTQVVRDAVIASDDTADLAQSAYGMAFLEAADRVISLGEKRGEPLRRIWKLPKNRTGEKINARQYMQFDVDRGVIGDQPAVEDETTGNVNLGLDEEDDY